MGNKLLNSIHLQGFLSFAPDSEPIELTNLNVLIGPNGVGKSNLIEAIELLHALPTDLAAAIRVGGLPSEWIWKGGERVSSARLKAHLPAPGGQEYLYAIEFSQIAGRLLHINNEDLTRPHCEERSPTVCYSQRDENQRDENPYDWDYEQSILSKRKDAGKYRVIADVGKRFSAIQVFREWTFGRSAALRTPQRTDLRNDVLWPDLSNLGLVLNHLEHEGPWDRFNELLRRFLPRYKRLTTPIGSGSVQIFLREDGLGTPIPATRLSDGTLRFIALLAILLNPTPASLICIEEPELGLHPDAVSLLGELLLEASEKTQLIVTTHSDVLVSAFTEQPESVLVCDYVGNGTTIRRLDPQNLTTWLEKYRLGEVWRIGELGGNP